MSEMRTPKKLKSAGSHLTEVIVGKDVTGSPAILSGGAARKQERSPGGEVVVVAEESKADNPRNGAQTAGI